MLRNAKIIDITGKNFTDYNFIREYFDLDDSYLDKLPNWYLIDGELYYFKKYEKLKDFVNELLGEEIAKLFNLPTVHYEIAFDGSNFGLLSKNFRKKDKIYLNGCFFSSYPSSKFYRNIYTMASRVNDASFRECFINELKRLMVMDYYRMETDRAGRNIYFEEDKGINKNTHLAPLLDYVFSFEDVYYDYSSRFIYFDLTNKIDLNHILNDEYLLEQFNYAYKIKLLNVLSMIEEERKFQIDKDLKLDYKDKNDKTKIILKEYGLVK